MMRPALAGASPRHTRRSGSRIGTASPRQSAGRTCGAVRGQCRSPADGSRRRSPRRSANAMYIVTRGKQRVVLARPQRALANKSKPTVAGLVELLVLIALVEADQPRGKMVVHRCHRPGRQDKTEQAETAVGGTKEKPLADTAPHPALWRILLKPPRQPIWPGEELPEAGSTTRQASAAESTRSMAARTLPMKARISGVSRTHSSCSSGSSRCSSRTSHIALSDRR